EPDKATWYRDSRPGPVTPSSLARSLLRPWSGHSSASRSFSSRSARALTDSSAPSPSARSVTSSPCAAPSAISISMLEACTALPPGFSMVTVAGCCSAALAKIPAGRACRPVLLAMVTVRSAMVGFPFECRGSGGWVVRSRWRDGAGRSGGRVVDRDAFEHCREEWIIGSQSGDLGSDRIRGLGAQQLLEPVDLLVPLGGEGQRGGEGIQQGAVGHAPLGELGGGSDDPLVPGELAQHGPSHPLDRIGQVLVGEAAQAPVGVLLLGLG